MVEIQDTDMDEADNLGDKSLRGARGKSTIVFPYFALEEAVGIAQIAHGQYGGRCDLDQLAASLKQKVSSGGFRLKVSASRIFGLTTTSGQTVSVTDLGSKTVDERTSAQSLVASFLTVPLYRALFDRFRGRTLPNDNGLEAAILDLGVSPKQVTTARQVFQRSADFAGFFAHGRDRLVMPAVGTLEGDNSSDNGGRTDDLPDDLGDSGKQKIMTHPLIVGILGALPEPGNDFPQEDREMWLEAARINLQLIYGKPKIRPVTPGTDGATFKGVPPTS